jgi:hypothetical protein
MRIFYDWRDIDRKAPKKKPLQGYKILGTKDLWLCWIHKDKYLLNTFQQQGIKGFIVSPKSIYLYDVYMAKSLWDALKYMFRKPKKADLKLFSELEDKCEADEVNKWACGFVTSREENLENILRGRHL